MPDPAWRPLAVVYNGLTISGPPFQLHEALRFGQSRDTATVSFDVVVTGESEEAFLEHCGQLEWQLREPYKGLTIEQSMGQSFAFGPAPETEVVGTVTKVGAPDGPDGALARLYAVQFEIALPADWSATNGLQSLDVDVSFGESGRRTVRISGTFISVDDTGARARYDAAIAALETSVLTAIGGTYERVEQAQAAHDLNDFRLEFDRVHREIIFSQAGASVDDVDIKSQRLSLTRSDRAPGDSPGGAGTPDTRRLTVLTADYEATLDKDSSTDLQGKWDNTIRSWILDQMSSTFSAGALAVVEEDLRVEPDDNRLVGRLVVWTALEGQTAYERVVTTRDDRDEDPNLVAAWNGDPYARYAFQGLYERTRTTTINQKNLGAVSEDEAEAIADEAAATSDANAGERSLSGNVATAAVERATTGAGGGAGGGGGAGTWTPGRRSVSTTPLRLGFGGDTLDATEVQIVITKQRYNPVSGGGFGGGGGSRTNTSRTPGHSDRSARGTTGTQV